MKLWLQVLHRLLKMETTDEQSQLSKVNQVLDIFRDCKVDEWAAELKDKYYRLALKNLDDIAVLSSRKTELEKLAGYLLQRDH